MSAKGMVWAVWSLAVAGVVLCGEVAASPLFASDRTTSCDGGFFAVPGPAEGTTEVYRASGDGGKTKVWSMRGWNDVTFLSDDGEWLAVGYPGNNLLDPGWDRELRMVEFFRRGLPTAIVRLRDLFPDGGPHRSTAESFTWGNYYGFGADGRFRVHTSDGRVLFIEAATGKVSVAASTTGSARSCVPAEPAPAPKAHRVVPRRRRTRGP